MVSQLNLSEAAPRQLKADRRNEWNGGWILSKINFSKGWFFKR